MSRAKNKLLWQNIALPQWDARRIYALFTKISNGRASKKDREEYVLMVMVLIAAFFARNRWIISLRRKRLDPEDVAVDILEHIRLKTPKIKLKSPCTPVLLAVLNQTIYRQIMTAIRKQRIVPDDLPVCDYDGDDEDRELIYYPRRQEDGVNRIERAMKEAEPDLCKGKWDDQIAICVLYRWLCRAVMRQNNIPPHCQLPTRLRRKVTTAHHATISYRLNKFLREFAASL